MAQPDSNGSLPIAPPEVTVEVNGISAPILAAQRSSISFQIPYGLDGVAAFDRQDVEFTGAIREGREPESSAASCVPTMALLDRIDRAMEAGT